MTFDTAAWAINGPDISASLARRAEYAATSGEDGVVLKDDLKVTQLGVPGVGVLIDAGVGLVVNRYQNTPNEAYVVSNPSTHTFSDIPPANASDQSYILAVVVGDPDFNQGGHPFMGSDDPPEGEETTFVYVRPVLVAVAPGATSLDVDYPALALARIDIPASTTTILDSMITDLRTLANPRQRQEIFVSPPSTYSNRLIPSGAAYADWGGADYAPSVKVPSWATRAIVVAKVNGANLLDSSVNIQGAVRASLGGVVGQNVSFNLPDRVGSVREAFEAAGEYDVTSIAGTSATLAIEAFEQVPASPTTNQRLKLDGWSQVIFDVRFFEE